MKKIITVLAAATLVLAFIGASVQATPERAAITDKKCGECHDPAKSEGNVKKLMVAFHKNCQGCHTEKSKEGIKVPDKKKCKECHQE